MKHGVTALVVIDMQNCYLERPPLDERRVDLVAAVNELVDEAVEHHAPVFTVRTEHQADRSTWTLNMLEDDQGFAFRGDRDAQLLDELHRDGTTEVVKTRDSAFLRTDLAVRLETADVDTIVICGVSTHTCVLATAADAYALNFDVILATDAISSHEAHAHEPVLAMLRDEYRQASSPNSEISFAGVEVAS